MEQNITHTHRFKVKAFEYRMMRNKTGRKILCNDRVHKEYSSLIIRVIKSRKTWKVLGRREMHVGFCWQNLKKIVNLGHLDVDGGKY